MEPQKPALDESRDPSYGHTVHLPGMVYEQARERIIAALKDQGFGILTEIDVKQTLRQKLGKEFRKYAILGACNPELAHRALEAELPVGLLLPCNVCVWEEDGGAVVSLLRPDQIVSVASNPALEPIAQEADQRLRRALEQLRAEVKH